MFDGHFFRTSGQRSLVVASFICLLGAAMSIKAATLPTGFTETQISGLSGPTAMEFAPDGRLFVCLQAVS